VGDGVEGMTMAKYIGSGTEVGEDQDDRRMNAYMAGINATHDDSEDEGEDEVEASHIRRQRQRARRAEY
jgi:hypothetical protein